MLDSQHCPASAHFSFNHRARASTPLPPRRKQDRKEMTMKETEINSYFAVDDQMLDSMAAEYETGTWKGTVGPIRAGRPHISDEDLTTISVRLPQSLLQTIDNKARLKKENRSQFLRDTLSRALQA
ncbi:hypothetical protein KIM372_01830 [Bombiscardovia nodaiensis]|uniref:Ribbon-helix-helix protein CopG domain-containing protein n=1 Tax=Bombiscardovia nodaiensis TaxID=2932181 RepID=A0ABN6SAW9_9BIFI|nr:hypothetical protein KIM372_01830 [Bombiscardovia nodaiensis]